MKHNFEFKVPKKERPVKNVAPTVTINKNGFYFNVSMASLLKGCENVEIGFDLNDRMICFIPKARKTGNSRKLYKLRNARQCRCQSFAGYIQRCFNIDFSEKSRKYIVYRDDGLLVINLKEEA